MNRYVFAGLLTIVALPMSGCVTMTEPTPIGDGRYLVTLNARGGFQSDGELLNQTISRANTFCAGLGAGQVANVVSSDAGGTQGWTPQHNQAVFRCEAGNK
jgi:hypothetical protein